MRLSLVFYVFLARMALGTVVSLVPLWRVRAAERHVRFQCLLALCLAGGAAALYGPATEAVRPALPGGLAGWFSPTGALPGALVALAGTCLVANWLWGTFRRRRARAALLVAAAFGLLATWGTVRLTLGGAPLGARAVATGGAVLGGTFMGAVNDAMILGHFFLMIPGLPVASLRRAGRFTAAVLLLRTLFLVGVVLFWGGAADVLLAREVVWFTWRVAFGIVGPFLLLWMVRDTVRLENTQAATGLLYVAIAFALLGEMAATYLEMQTGIPV